MCVCVCCVYCRIIVFELLNNVGWNIIGYFSHLSVNICKTEIDCHTIHVSSHFRDSFLVSNHSHFNFLEIGRDLCLCIWVCWSLPGYNSVSSPASETWNTANPSWWHWRWRSCSCCAINFIIIYVRYQQIFICTNIFVSGWLNCSFRLHLFINIETFNLWNFGTFKFEHL